MEEKHIHYIVAIATVLLIIGATGAWYLFSRVEPQDASVELTVPDQVLLGQPFKVFAAISNDSDTILDEVRIVVSVPQGISFVGAESGQRASEHVLGDLGPGSVNRQEFQLVASEGASSVKRITAKVVYKTTAKASYESIAEREIVIGEPVVRLGFTVPEKVFSGENFDIVVNFENTSNEDLKGLELKMEYPQAFQFQKGDVDPTKGNNIWNLGTIARHSSSSVTISGTLVGQDGIFFNFGGVLSAEFLGEKYVLNTQSAKLSLASSPLSLEILANDSTDYTTRLGDTLTYALRYRNNSDVTLSNATIKAVLAGELFDYFTIQSQGFFNSITNSVTWSAANTPALGAIAPGDSGEVRLVVQVKNAFPIRRLSDKNFILKIQAQIESPTVPAGTASSKTLSVASLQTKVRGAIAVTSKALSRDASSGFVNNGPFPPVANRATQYTVHWNVLNYGTDVASVKVTARIQANTRVVGKSKSTIDTKPIYNPSSGEISWIIPTLAATKGVVGEPIEAVFQVENTPSVLEIGRQVTFLSDTQITATDNFTGGDLSGSAPMLTTALPYDPAVANIGGYVQP